jgi:hypothetical protein
VLACLGAVAIAVPLAEQAQLAVSQGDVAAGRFAGALRSAATAHRIEPFAVGPTLQQALILEQLGALHLARAALAHSIAEMATDWQLWVTEARLDAELRDAAGARTALHLARSLNPRSPATAGAIVNGPHGSVEAPASLLGLGACVPSGVSDLVQSVETIPTAACAVADPGVRTRQADRRLVAQSPSAENPPRPVGEAWPLGVLETLATGAGPGGLGPAAPIYLSLTLLTVGAAKLRAVLRRRAKTPRANARDASAACDGEVNAM